MTGQKQLRNHDDLYLTTNLLISALEEEKEAENIMCLKNKLILIKRALGLRICQILTKLEIISLTPKKKGCKEINLIK